MIGDVDPEDAYDASDPLDVRLGVLVRVALDLRQRDDDRRDARRADALRVLVNLERDHAELGARIDDVRAELEDL